MTETGGLMAGGMSEARSWGDTLLCTAESGQDKAAAFTPRGQGEFTSYRGNYVRLAPWLPGKPAERHALYFPFDKLLGTIISWDLGQVCRKVSPVSRL